MISASTKKKEYVWLWALLLLAAAVRLPGIFTQPFWSDEYFSWLTAKEPTFIQFFLRCAGIDVYPPLSYFPIWILAKFNDAQWVLRLPSGLMGLACIWAAWRLLRRYLSPGQALALAALVAFCPLSVYLGWEAKAYNTFAFFNLLLLDETLRLLEQPGRGAWRLALWVAASMYSFFLSPYFVAIVFMAAWWMQGRRLTPALKQVLKGCVMGMLAALPLAPFFIKTVLLYAASSASNTALWKAPFYSLENFSAGFWMAPKWQLAALLPFGLSTVLAIKSLKGASWVTLLIALAFLPPLLMMAISSLGKPNYNDRSMLISAFCWCLLAGWGALALKTFWRGLLLTLLLGAQLFSLAYYQVNPQAARFNYSKAWHEVTKQWQGGDVIFHAYFESGMPFKYYAAREVESGQRATPRGNFIREGDPGFTQNNAAQGIRALWRKLNAWLGAHGMGLYAGYDPMFVWGQRLDEVTRDAKRIWYIVPSRQTARRQMMQIPNAFRGGDPFGRNFDFANETWLTQHWRLASQSGNDDLKIYLFVRTGAGRG